MEKAGKKISLKFFIVAATLVVSFTSFTTAYLITSAIYRNILSTRANELSKTISRHTMDAMLLLMKRGWSRKELNEFIDSLKAESGKMPYKIEIYRGAAVEVLYGKTTQPEPDTDIRQAISSGLPIETKNGYEIKHTFPIGAREICLGCHGNVKVGDSLGALRVTENIESAVKRAKARLLKYFFILSPIPVGIALGLAFLFNIRVRRSTAKFQDKVKQINTVKDLTTLDVDKLDMGFSELNDVMKEISMMVDKMKDIAIDKTMMEFEITLLEKFIITSDVVRDWKEHVANLLLEINKVVEAYTLFSIFMVDDDYYELEIFWKGRPTAGTIARVEKIVNLNITKESHKFAQNPGNKPGQNPVNKPGHNFGTSNSKVNITHNIADETVDLRELSEADLELQTKSLILETPRIGGVVGIGVQSEITKDPIRTLVIDSVLTTLLNVVGSIKAIYKYTRDMEFYATRDPLTNLFNQRVFWELLHYEIGRAHRRQYSFALLVVDFDNFKLINDRYGHHVGDKFLQEASTAMRASLREGDIMARYGGDEFTAILPEIDENQTFTAALRLKELMEKMSITAPDGTKIKATMSIGLAMYPQHATEIKDLFMVADNMMYKAKKAGKNSVQFPTMEDITDTFRKTEEKSLFLLSIVEEKDKIIPYFQPIMNIKTKGIEINEMLMRIEHEGRIMPAGEFIDVAEDLGIVHKLDYILIEKAFVKIKAEKYDGTLFINLSPKALIISEFISNVRKLTSIYRIDPSKIVFEITERETVRNLALLEKFVLDLKLEGFNFAIDDFGSGFSSFQYIKRFPVDYIKIEGEFVKHMAKDDVYRAFVKSIVILAQELNIKAIAEFVEDADILRELETLGVTYGQGYFIGRPSAELKHTVA